MSYSALVGVKTAVADARALLKGPFSYLSTFPVVGRALSTAKFTNGGQSTLSASGENEYRMDGDLFLASHLVSQTSPSPSSPSQTVAHDLFAGCFSKAVIMATFGPGILIEANPYLDQVKGNVMFFGTLMWDLGVPVPEAIAHGNNILLS